MFNEIVWPGLIVVPEAPNGIGGDAGLGGIFLLLNSGKKNCFKTKTINYKLLKVSKVLKLILNKNIPGDLISFPTKRFKKLCSIIFFLNK